MPAKPRTQASTHPTRARSAAGARILPRLRAICLDLPEANERVSHGEPTWFAGKGKVFAMFDDHHHGADHVAVWLPMPRGAQEALVESDPARYFRPPYVGPSGWVGVILDREPDWEGVATLVRDAYLHVATARLRALVAGPAPATAPRGAKGRTAPPARGASADATRSRPTTLRRWVALLRGINLGKHRRLAMTAVREACEVVGATDVATYIQSGNVVFSHALAAEPALARALEEALAAVAGFEVPVILRSGEELTEVRARSPFPRAAPAALHVAFLAEPPAAGWAARVDGLAEGEEQVRFVGRELHLHLPGGIGRSKLALALTKLGGPPATVRNWRTVEALAAMVAAGSRTRTAT